MNTTHDSHTGQHPTLGMYIGIYVALLVLLGVTVAAAEVDLGAWNFFVTVAIASVKALLIVLFFMHVRYSRPLTWLFAGAGFFWLAILFGMTMNDYMTRLH